MLVHIDETEARRRAEAKLAEWNQHRHRHDPDGDMIIDRVEEHAKAWIIIYVTRRFRETGNVVDLPVGTAPIVVAKATGDVHVYGSGPDGYARYLAWRDDQP